MDSADSTSRKGEAGDSGEVAINHKNRVLDNEGGNAAPPTRKASSWEGCRILSARLHNSLGNQPRHTQAHARSAPEVRTPGEEVRGWGGCNSLPALAVGQPVHLTVRGRAQELLPRGPRLPPAGRRGSCKVTGNRVQRLKESAALPQQRKTHRQGSASAGSASRRGAQPAGKRSLGPECDSTRRDEHCPSALTCSVLL